jgi:tetratricopeptide (TPR) repeat protein
VTRDSDTPEFTVHGLLQDVTRKGLTEEERRVLLGLALGWVSAAFKGEPQDARSWPVLDPLLPHALAVAEHPDSESVEGPIARLFRQCGVLLYAKAQYARAELLCRRALAIDEVNFGPEYLNVATDLNNLAALLQATNRLSEAEPLMQRVLRMLIEFTRTTGHRHPHLYAAANNDAGLLMEMGHTQQKALAAVVAVAPDLFEEAPSG